VSAAWVAGSVRATALSRRRIGPAGARALAASPSLDDALVVLAATPYGHDVRTGQTLGDAQRGVADTLLWHLRVLAGWLPREGAGLLRLLAGAFEIANVEEHVDEIAGADSAPPYHLGTLATAWPRLARTATLVELRDVLASSPWGDPQDSAPQAICVGMRLSWLARVASSLPEAASWAATATALVVARETHLDNGALSQPLRWMATEVVGSRSLEAGSLRDLANALPREARWVLDGITDPEDLWRAEARWWHRVESDGFALLRRSRFGRATVLGAVAVLATDAWRVRGALELAARGGAPLEAFDAVA